MHPKPFEYFAPKSLEGVFTLLHKYRGDAKILAGGHSLIPLMKLRLAAPKYVIDINGVKGLSGIRKAGKEVHIGALTRYYQVESSELLQGSCPILCEAVTVIGDPQVRHMGTVGGNIAHGDPANDLPPVMLALGASFVVTNGKKQRNIPAEKFFLDLFTTSLTEDEVLTKVIVPVPPRCSGGAYLKFERRAGDFAVVSVAVQLALADGVCKRAGIGLGASAIKPLRAKEAETLLVNHAISDQLIEKAAKKAAQASDPIADLRGSAQYKREMVRVFTKRALMLARDRGSANS